MSDAVLRLDDVRKSFTVHERRGRVRRVRREVHAVDGLSLEVPAGQVCGYIGPNGAGKSTTVKLLTGILTATSGKVLVAGLDPVTHRVELARQVGVVFGQRTQLWWDLPLGDSFQLLRHLYRRTADDHATRLAQLVEVLDLGALLQQPVRQLSLGQRMRGDLAAALLHRPSVLYLDEPTIGLDVVSKIRIRDFLLELNREEGTTILLTTHDLTDVERLCDRLVVIDHGHVITDDTVEGVKRSVGGNRVLVVDFDQERPAVVTSGVLRVEVEGPRQRLELAQGANPADVLEHVVAIGGVRDLTVEEPSIDDVVRTIYARSGSA